MIKSWTRSITTICAEPRVRTVALAAYYVAVLGGVLLMSTLGAFETPTFVYQGF